MIKRIENKGITLIALVITIIVLLILAGITIASLTGENGILTKAQKTVEKNNYGVAEEKVKLAVMEYHTNMKEKTMYSILTNIDGFESISPDDENMGMPYDVIVDGYIFTVKENEETKGIEVEYKGKSNGIKPEIISAQVTNINSEEAKITVTAKTKDTDGLEKVIVTRNGIKINEKIVNGTNITVDFSVNGNGKYKVIVVGKNAMRVESEELEVSGLDTLSGTISAGTVLDGEVLLTITGESVDSNISKIEIYEDTTRIGEMLIEEQTKSIEKRYKLECIPFYTKKSYRANIISDIGETFSTNSIVCENKTALATKTDFDTLNSEVLKGNLFNGKTLKLVKDIQEFGDFRGIGNDDYRFEGTFEGNKHIISRTEQLHKMLVRGKVDFLMY